jgi:hypothetical protein
MFQYAQVPNTNPPLHLRKIGYQRSFQIMPNKQDQSHQLTGTSPTILE